MNNPLIRLSSKFNTNLLVSAKSNPLINIITAFSKIKIRMNLSLMNNFLIILFYCFDGSITQLELFRNIKAIDNKNILTPAKENTVERFIIEVRGSTINGDKN